MRKSPQVSRMMNYQKIPFDIRLEILATVLLNADVDFDQLVIHPQGMFYRNYKNEVLAIEETEESKKKKKLHISVFREGLYDTLPEGLFHESMQKGPHIDTEESVEEIKRHQKEEKEARMFFLPLEQEFYRLQIEAEIQESNLLLSHFDRKQYEVFMDLWDIPNELSDDQVMLLLYIIPSLHKMVGNTRLIQLCFSLMLGVGVRLQLCPIPVKHENTTEICRLGTTWLGIDSVLGDFVGNADMGVKLIVGPVPKSTIKDYLTGGKSHALIQYLSTYFLPVHMDYTITLLLEKKDQEFQIYEENTGSGILGYSTSL